MALGGGTFLTQNKVLPGSYINFISAAKASVNLSDRGIAAMALELDWGVDGKIFTVSVEDFQKNAMEIFGYGYTHDKLKGLRDLFKNIKTGVFYRVNSGVKAGGDIGEAMCSGSRGNALYVDIIKDSEDNFTVSTYFGATKVDEQKVSETAELLDNAYIKFDRDRELINTERIALTGGANSVATQETSHETFLGLLEGEVFNTLGCLSEVSQIADLYVNYTKRMRDDNGVKFQLVVFNTEAEHEGIINLVNGVDDEVFGNSALIYWVTGIAAGCEINKSNTNKAYDGEFLVKTPHNQSELKKGIEKGRFLLHKVGDKIRVLDDINSFTEVTPEKNGDFSSNQVIRVLDQVANDIAVLFNTKYLGKVQNNTSGRLSFWNDVVKYNKELELLGAIENFVADEVLVGAGSDKKTVTVTNPIMPINAMTKLYMTVIVE